MENKPIWIFKSGKLVRKGNTLYFYYNGQNGTEEKKVIPINAVSDIYVYGRVWLSPGVIDLLSKGSVPLHFFSYYGFYRSSLMPKKSLLSGSTIVSQVKAYLNNEMRLHISKEFIMAASNSIVKNLKEQLTPDLYNYAQEQVYNLQKSLYNAETIGEIMAIEGNIRSLYYDYLDKVLPDAFKINIRVRRPPNSPMNALISFGNSLMYANVLSQIYNTHLDPTVSFLHEPFERRYSLALDISEIFKPFIVDRLILKLINKNMIDLSYFDEKLNYAVLNEKGKKLFVSQFDDRLQDTIKHKTLNRNVSYRHLIRLECYKLEKYILGISDYKAFRMWW